MAQQTTSPEMYGADEYSDEQPRLTCNRCGGEALHVRTTTTNSWINSASAYDSYDYECVECGATGGDTENHERTGCVAVPVPEDPPEARR